MFSAQYVALYIGFHAITLPFCLGDEKHHSVGIAPESRQILPIRVIATHDDFSHACTVFAAQKFVPAVLTLGFESPTRLPHARPFNRWHRYRRPPARTDSAPEGQ